LSFTRVQLEGAVVISVVFHKPPSTPPINTVLCVASFESTITALILPDAIPPLARVLPLEGPGTSLFGPLSCQVSAVILESDELLDSIVLSMAAINLSLGTLPVAGSFVLSNSYLAANAGPSYISFSSSSRMGELLFVWQAEINSSKQTKKLSSDTWDNPGVDFCIEIELIDYKIIIFYFLQKKRDDS